MDDYLSRAALVRRGWTATTIATLLGEPDALGPERGGARRTHLFNPARVLAAEAAGGWQSRSVAPKVEKPSRDELAALRATGLTRQEMADRLGVSLAMVKRCLAEAGIVAPKRSRAPKPAPKITQVDLDDDDGLGLVEIATRRLVMRGHTVTHDRVRGCYRIDGEPVTVSELLRRAGVQEREAPEKAFRRIEGGMAARDRMGQASSWGIDVAAPR